MLTAIHQDHRTIRGLWNALWKIVARCVPLPETLEMNGAINCNLFTVTQYSTINDEQ